VPKRKIHFIGFLANVDDSILKLKLKNGFEIKKLSQQEVMPFLRKIDFYYGVDSRVEISGFYCITKQSVAEFEGTPQGGVVGNGAEVKRFVLALRDKIRVLRLFKEGNIVLRFSFFYHMKDSGRSVISMHTEEPVGDKTKFRLEDNEILEAQSFIDNMQIPFKQEFLQLAFENFELSYKVSNINLAFLSLMIGFEALFTRQREGLSYALARNAAVLLGESKQKSEHIFRSVKKFYSMRGNLVHQSKRGEIAGGDVLELRGYLRDAIKEMKAIGKGKKDILEELKARGFGQRPWRQNE